MGEFLPAEECQKYGLPQPKQEQAETPIRGEAMEFNFGVQLTFSGEENARTSHKTWVYAISLFSFPKTIGLL
ncbi:hypothetical protein [Dactylococcopsis salina]|uniref:hypothetical protein n=1 Tax=Dactylococcopsis salina TaxID=292566 RepID=UPI00031C356A|nr:hypothetical protein [Dactylococcopsis salina]